MQDLGAEIIVALREARRAGTLNQRGNPAVQNDRLGTRRALLDDVSHSVALASDYQRFE